VSYVRIGQDGSQVYIYPDVDGYVSCCFCPLDADPRTRDAEVMLAHVAAHRAAGHHVPAWVEADLRDDWPRYQDRPEEPAR
jgi:hypothetical protein